MFEFRPPITCLKATAESGQLNTIIDAAAAHKTGTVYYDGTNDKTYVYVENSISDAVTANAPYMIAAMSDASGVTEVKLAAATNLPTTNAYFAVPPVAIPGDYFGWVLVQGQNAAVSGLVSEARTAGGTIVFHNDGTFLYAAAGAWGVSEHAFAYVKTANTAASTTGSLDIIGREITGA